MTHSGAFLLEIKKWHMSQEHQGGAGIEKHGGGGVSKILN